MKHLILLILFSQFCFSQTVFEKNSHCEKTKNISEKARLTKFPFSKSIQIKLISLKSESEEIVGQDLIKHIDSIKIGKDIFKPEFYTEVATLNTAQTNELTDVIFNYSYKKKPYSISAASCYMPRNAILFLDNNNIIIAYLEFCFSCDGFRTSSKDFGIGEYCNEKYEMIKAIFKESKIVYGITETE